jgi:hypothetical protein
MIGSEQVNGFFERGGGHVEHAKELPVYRAPKLKGTEQDEIVHKLATFFIGAFVDIQAYILEGKIAAFEVVFDKKIGKWVIPLAVCFINGCTYEFLECSGEQEALNGAIQLTLDGEEVDRSRACPGCRVLK